MSLNKSDNFITKKSLCLICNNNYKVISDPETREVICTICGQVLSDQNEQGINNRINEEITNVADSESGTRYDLKSQNSSSVFPYNIESPTRIGRTNVDAAGRQIGSDMGNIMEKLRILEKRTRYNSSADRNLRYAFEQMTKLKYKLGISDIIIQKSFYFYRKAQALGIIRGRSIDGIVSASIYLACKEFETPKTLKEISKAANVKIKTISHYYRILVIEFGLRTVPVIDPIKCITKIINKTDLNESVKRKAIQIMTKVKQNKIHEGKNPMVIAASTIYAAYKLDESNIDKTTQIEIAKSVGISDSVLRKWYNDIVDNLNLNLIK